MKKQKTSSTILPSNVSSEKPTFLLNAMSVNTQATSAIELWTHKYLISEEKGFPKLSSNMKGHLDCQSPETRKKRKLKK